MFTTVENAFLKGKGGGMNFLERGDGRKLGGLGEWKLQWGCNVLEKNKLQRKQKTLCLLLKRKKIQNPH